MDKNLLILRGHKDICGNEIGLIVSQCEFMRIGVFTEDLVNEYSFEEIIHKHLELGRCFDFIYLCSHGDHEGFDINMDGNTQFMSWAKFGQAICESSILNDDTIFLLACCRGGLFSVATDLIAVCNKINFVCGVKWKARGLDITTGFLVILYNLVFKKSELSYACQKATLATDFTFACFDRSEIECHSNFYNRQDQIYEEIGWTDNGQIVIQDTDVFSNTSLGKI